MSEIYKCQICYKVAEVLSQGGGNLFCCNTPMEALRENIDDTHKLTHLPVMEKIPKFRGALLTTAGPGGQLSK